jgi:CRISPR-associated endonuclease Csn1
MEKTLALDLGTNSIGWAIRDRAYQNAQFRKFGVLTFNQGMGEEKNVEYSFAAQRTAKRSIRRLYQARKYKLWETLDMLRRSGYCPITEKSLNQWRWYKKHEGYFRKYPVDDEVFNQWIKLDFDGDGKPDYSTPYQLRQELINQKLDFQQEVNKHKLGRALYHISQHRAFKSSKKVNLTEDVDADIVKIGAEGKRENDLTRKLNEIGITEWKTIGDAFAQAEIIFKNRKDGRIRNNLHTSVVRKDLQQEVNEIFNYQRLCFGDIFKNKKDEKLKISQSPIFWQRPLRSQKGTIGKCTLEPSKYRCPASHPAFEEFRAWSFLNNIKYKNKGQKDAVWKSLDLETKKELYNEKFTRVIRSHRGRLKPNFDFYEIHLWLKKRNQHDNWDLNYNFKTNVAACPVSAQLRAIFGDDWQNVRLGHTASEKRNDKKDHYDIIDIWHIPFSSDDEDFIKDFAENKLQLDEVQIKKYLALWKSMPVDYGQLSVKAINNILRFLRRGLIYTEATLLAKIPEVLGEELWKANEQLLISSIADVIEGNRKTKKQLGIVNSLIAQYKTQPNTEKFAEHDFKYKLYKSDTDAILQAIEETYGKTSWNEKTEEEKQNTVQFITSEYQSFFNDPKRQFKKMPHLLDSMKQFLCDNFELHPSKLKKLYHPSQIEIYPPAKRQTIEDKELLLLGSPKTDAFKNPMAMRALHELRKLVNYLIKTDQIDEHTRIVVELARELNDANKRWAYEKYQQLRREENAEFAAAIHELIKDSDAVNISVNPDNAEDIDKFRLWYDMMQGEDAKIGIEKGGIFIENTTVSKRKKSRRDDEEYEVFSENNFEKLNKALYFRLKKAGEDVVNKYKLWKQQNCECIYTGKPISITQLFQDTLVDFEHTIPRSQSFDNSLENLTVCYAGYNRKIKKNQIPFHLPNYEEESNGYSAIKPRLKKWKQKVEDLEKHIEFWKAKSKTATTKEDKDKAIRQKHLWQFELDYWRAKLYRFTIEEVKIGFRNSQLVDTQVISKYASHYLRTVFSKVEVQKGSVTSDFRKIFGIQQLDERKDRGIHSHHAKDAIVLSVIPTTALREQILKVWNELEEQRDFLKGTEASQRSEVKNRIDFLERELNKLVDECHLPNVNGAIDTLDEEIVINNRTTDQTLSPAKRKLRSRGKVVAVKDKVGNPVFKTDEDGKPKQLHIKGKPVFKNNEFGKPLLNESGNTIPVLVPKEKWAKGDIIRGQLHKDSFYGAIKLVKKNEHGKFVKGEDGKFTFEDVKYVIREDLVYKVNPQSPGFKSLEDLESQIVDMSLFAQIKKQVETIGNFKEALSQGLWMLNKNGERVNKIRRVRVFVRSTNPIAIKLQTNISNKPLKILDNRNHKQSYWVDNKERPYLAMYQKNGKLNPETYSLIDIAQRASKSLLPFKNFIDLLEKVKNDGSELVFTLQKGKRIIFLKDPIEEISVLPDYFQKSLYKVEGFEEDGRTTLKYHLESREQKKIKENMKERGLPDTGATVPNFEYPIPLLRVRLHTTKKGGKRVYNFAVEGKDFEIKPDGKLDWNRKIIL